MPASSHHLHERLVEDALTEARDQRLEQIDRLANALKFLQYGLDDLADWEDVDGKRNNFSRHDRNPIRTISAEKERHIDGLERLASEYLSTPYRNEKIDRVLVDLLIVQELYAFGSRDRVFNRLLWALGFQPRALRAMVIVYSELNSSGVVSAKRMHHIVTESSREYKIVWPPTLYAVLDDSISRNGRLAPFP